jgi:hypothetical protein
MQTTPTTKRQMTQTSTQHACREQTCQQNTLTQTTMYMQKIATPRAQQTKRQRALQTKPTQAQTPIEHASTITST